jgi:hypothetical protein
MSRLTSSLTAARYSQSHHELDVVTTCSLLPLLSNSQCQRSPLPTQLLAQLAVPLLLESLQCGGVLVPHALLSQCVLVAHGLQCAANDTFAIAVDADNYNYDYDGFAYSAQTGMPNSITGYGSGKRL